jgi:hypothetical protein
MFVAALVQQKMGERGNEGLTVLICDDDRTCQTRSMRPILSSTTIYQASKVEGGKTAANEE